jgi:hypothetical protein
VEKIRKNKKNECYMDNILVRCPHCSDLIIINKKDFNCKIFRHGVYKNDNKQIDPHLNKDDCDRLLKEGLIYGCVNRLN